VNAYGYDVDDVLRCVDPALDDLDEPSLLYVKYVREEFVRAAATLDAYPLPAKIRQAVESLFGGVFEISRIGGEDRGRRRERRARTLKATSSGCWASSRRSKPAAKRFGPSARKGSGCTICQSCQGGLLTNSATPTEKRGRAPRCGSSMPAI
jgi:hypothetical protein